MDNSHPLKLKKRISSAFEKKAIHYEEFSFLQQEVGQKLFNCLDLIENTPSELLDLGCGTSWLLRSLRRKYPGTTITSIDIAEAMLQEAKTHHHADRLICADMDNLPFGKATFDTIFSNLAVQWSFDYASLFGSCKEILKTNGFLIFSTLSKNTLWELRESWSHIDAKKHTNEFPEIEEILETLEQNFHIKHFESESKQLYYGDIFSLAQSLKTIGANTIMSSSSSGLTGRSIWETLSSHYEKFRIELGLPLTYEVVYGIVSPR